jgi:DNA polymerase-3 subunit epsilon
MSRTVENGRQVRDIGDMERSLEHVARLLIESGDYRVTSRLEPQAEYHPPDSSPKLVGAIVDVETTGTNPNSDRIIELGICLFDYDRQNGRIYKVFGSWEWFEDPGFSIPPEITNITGITDEMVAGHRIDDRAVSDLLGRVVLVIAHNASFDRRFLERRLPAFATKHWACSRSHIDWNAEGIRSSALEFVAYSLGFFHDGHRAANDCRATLHALAQPLPGTGRLALQALLEQARLPTWRSWARDAAIEKKDALKARGYAWSRGDFGRPRCWYRDVADADRAAEVSWLRANALGPNQAVWALRITARNRYSDRCWSWGESLDIALECAAGRHGRRWSGVMTPDIVREFGKGRTIGQCSGSAAAFVLTSANHPGPHLGQWATSHLSEPRLVDAHIFIDADVQLKQPMISHGLRLTKIHAH